MKEKPKKREQRKTRNKEAREPLPWGPGRPRDSINDTKITFKLRTAKRKHIQRVAASQGLKEGTWIRQLIYKELRSYLQNGTPK